MILAKCEITIAHMKDINSVTWYYKLQASTASPPAKPTAATPSGWTTTEPAYVTGSTNSLYVCEKTTFSDGTFEYSDVSLSSSYEAAKAAYNKAETASTEIRAVNQYFWHTTTGDDAGAHITEVTQEEFLADPANGGANLLARSNGIAVRNGLTELATFGADGVTVGALGQSKSSFSADKMSMLDKFGVSTFTIDQTGTQEETKVNKLINEVRAITGIQPDGYDQWTWADAAAGGKDGGSLRVSCLVMSYSHDIARTITATFTVGTTATHVSDVTAGNVPCRIEITYDASGAISVKASKPSGSAAYWLLFGSVYYDAYINMPVYSFGRRADGDRAYGSYNTIIGEDLIGSGPRQTVIGKYNVEDANGDYVFIIGNGSSSARSNALTVAWDGTVESLGGLRCTQLAISNYDQVGGTLYTGQTNIDDIGDGTITGAIKALVPDISKQSGSTTSVPRGTNTTIQSISLKKGRYLLIGVGTFPAGSGRCNLHFSMTGNSGEADKYASVAVPLGNGVIRPQVTWTTTISTDGTTVYLIAYHTSDSTVNVTNVGIQVVPLDGGGICS